MRILVTILANALALFLVSRILEGFTFEGGLIAPVIVALILTVLNFILKPLLGFYHGRSFFDRAQRLHSLLGQLSFGSDGL